MNHQRAFGIVCALALAVPCTGFSQFQRAQVESPISHMIEIKFGFYVPGIDSEAGLSGKPYQSIFGEESVFTTRIEYAYQFWRGFGSIAVGLETGYGSVSGHGVEAGTKTESADETKLHIFPMAISLVYHMDEFAKRWNVPLVPYIKAGLDYNIWCITDGVGETAEYSGKAVKGQTPLTFEGKGDTWGWHVTAGMKILLDVFAPRMARTFDADSGVNNSYLFAEVVYADISDFGSDTSFQLGDLVFLFGMAFEF